MIRKRRRYFAAHPEADLTATMEKMKRGLLAYGQGKTDVETALKKEGLSAPRAGTHTMYVMSYIGQQAALLEEQGNNGELYSIKTNEDGVTYVDVDTDQDIFKGVDESEYKNIAKEYIKNHFVGKYLGKNEDILVNGRSAKEYAYPANRRIPREIKNGKYKAATELDNMLSIAEYIRHEETEVGKHEDAVNGWDVYKVLYKVGDRYFSGESQIKLTENGPVFYDITKIRDITRQLRPAQQGAENRGLSNASDISISEDSENVNGKFSLSSEVEEENVKKKYMEQTDTRQFKRWFRGSEAVNADGTPKIFYHGTPNGTFNTFRNWQYFTENKAYADGYQNQGASSNGYKKTAENKKTYAVYLQTGKVFDTRNSAEREIFENEFYGKWGNGTPLSERGLPDWTDGDDLIEFFDENGYDYDTILLDEGGTGGYGEDVKDRGISYVIKDSSQIKSATDNVGTFDSENPDIRYSINEKNGQTQLPDVTEDAELSAQAAGDEDMRAALMLVQRLYDTARNGEGYLELNGRGAIQAGDWQKRVEGIRDRLLSETGSGYGKGALTRRLNAILC